MTSILPYLKEKWPDVVRYYAPETLQQLEQAYGDPSRHYHGAAHILDLLAKLEAHKDIAKRPDLIAHAILWHDAVYRTHDQNAEGSVTHRPDTSNVEDSARWFEKLELNLPPDDRAKVAAMIRATSGHDARLAREHPDFNDTALFLDLDLSVLASSYEEFKKNTQLIRMEYPHVGDGDFCLGRSTFLNSYRQKKELFFHPVTAKKYDSAARGNMKRQMGDLRQQIKGLPKLF